MGNIITKFNFWRQVFFLKLVPEGYYFKNDAIIEQVCSKIMLNKLDNSLFEQSIFDAFS